MVSTSRQRGHGGKSPPGTQAVDRAMKLLQCFEPGSADLSLTDLAAQVGLERSTAHRLLGALCRGGLLEQNASTERYGPGPHALIVGIAAMEKLGFGDAAQVLHRVVEETGESVALGIRHGDEVLVAIAIASPQSLRFELAPGARLPLHASALGKALLTWAPGRLRDSIAALPTLRAATQRTITNRSALLADLEGHRGGGYTISDEELYEGVRALAVPAFDRSQRLRAAVSVQAPAFRLDQQRIDKVAPMIQAAAGEIGTRLPYF